MNFSSRLKPRHLGRLAKETNLLVFIVLVEEKILQFRCEVAEGVDNVFGKHDANSAPAPLQESSARNSRRDIKEQCALFLTESYPSHIWNILNGGSREAAQCFIKFDILRLIPVISRLGSNMKSISSRQVALKNLALKKGSPSCSNIFL